MVLELESGGAERLLEAADRVEACSGSVGSFRALQDEGAAMGEHVDAGSDDENSRVVVRHELASHRSALQDGVSGREGQSAERA
jgi:hypothetical protein